MPTDTSFLSEPIMEMDQEQSSMPESSESIAFLPDSNSIGILVIRSHWFTNHECTRSCGNINNITFPFRLNGDPINCGYLDYQLTCEHNQTVLTLNSRKYYVQSINYSNYTIRVVDPDVQENNICSFPKYDLAQYRFSGYHSSYDIASTTYVPIIFLSCPFPMKSSAFVETTKECWNNKSSGGRNAPQLYSYAKVGRLYASDLRISCRVDLITMTSLQIQEKNVSSSLLEIHDALMYGFELFWFNAVCYQSCLFRHLCYLDNVKHEVKCNGTHNTTHYCNPSSCGSIRNISSPFRLNTDPENCGNPDYQLTCDEQNRTVLTLNSQKYYVQSINYDNYTVRVVDPGVQQNNICSFPRYALAQYSFPIYYDSYPYDIAKPLKMTPYDLQHPTLITVPIFFLRCPFPMKSSAFVETTKECWNKSSDSSGGYAYAKLGSLPASDLRISCRVELITMTSWRIQENVSSQKVSLLEIHDAMMYGFELSWFSAICQQHCGKRPCYLDLKNEINCDYYYFQSHGKNEK
nr:LEAF RUST 10 DISEASE-RESISTANCE LOCUS RECEPTOR-LIKE PROTEIN KINASE-like 2.1 [Ipomoea trifida]